MKLRISISSIIPQFEFVDGIGYAQINKDGSLTKVAEDKVVDGKVKTLKLVPYAPEGVDPQSDDYKAKVKRGMDAYEKGDLKELEEAYKAIGIEWKAGRFIQIVNGEIINVDYNPATGAFTKEDGTVVKQLTSEETKYFNL